MNLATLLMIASLYWGHTPACGQPGMYAGPLTRPTAVAQADRIRCRITVLPSYRRWPAGQACVAVVHEYGHLLGMEHSKDYADPMYPVVHAPVSTPCKW